MYVYEYILQHNQKNYASIKDSLVLTSKFGIDALHGALNRMQRWGSKNPGFKTGRDEFITVWIKINKQKNNWVRKENSFHWVNRTRLLFFFFFAFHSEGDCLCSLFSATCIACILIEVFNSNIVKNPPHIHSENRWLIY